MLRWLNSVACCKSKWMRRQLQAALPPRAAIVQPAMVAAPRNYKIGRRSTQLEK